MKRAIFLDFWKTESSKFDSLQTYRDDLNGRFADLFNIDSRTVDHPPGLGRRTDAEEYTDDIVEILSLNRLRPAGLQNAEAILAHRSGQLLKLTIPESVEKVAGRKTNDGPDRLIRYDLDPEAVGKKRESDFETSFVERIFLILLISSGRPFTFEKKATAASN